MDSGKRAWSGSFLELWLDGDKVGEAYGIQAKMAYDKEDVPRCGTLATDTKVMGLKGTGSIRMYRVSSRMGRLLGEAMRAGRDPRFTIIAKLADPDAYGAERLALYGVSFDDLSLLDAEAKTVSKVECPFTFTDFEYLDSVEAE